ncbi:hypothetical protein STRDD11_00660 [Streptococcus sp. DD11]|nr:hypothetical protein STRDD11_00660 [Streptococcus sp. DD11]
MSKVYYSTKKYEEQTKTILPLSYSMKIEIKAGSQTQETAPLSNRS